MIVNLCKAMRPHIFHILLAPTLIWANVTKANDLNNVLQLLSAIAATQQAQQAAKDWEAADKTFSQCMLDGITKSNISLDQLIQNGYGPQHPELKPFADACNTIAGYELKTNVSCTHADRGKQYSTWCDEAFVLKSTKRPLTKREAWQAAFNNSEIELRHFERIDAEKRRLEMVRIKPSWSSVPVPNFNCANATSKSELTVCASFALSMLDFEFGGIYRETVGKGEKSSANKIAHEEYKKTEACAGRQNCIKLSKESAIDALDDVLTSAGYPIETSLDVERKIKRQQEEKNKPMNASATLSDQSTKLETNTQIELVVDHSSIYNFDPYDCAFQLTVGSAGQYQQTIFYYQPERNKYVANASLSLSDFKKFNLSELNFSSIEGSYCAPDVELEKTFVVNGANSIAFPNILLTEIKVEETITSNNGQPENSSNSTKSSLFDMLISEQSQGSMDRSGNEIASLRRRITELERQLEGVKNDDLAAKADFQKQLTEAAEAISKVESERDLAQAQLQKLDDHLKTTLEKIAAEKRRYRKFAEEVNTQLEEELISKKELEKLLAEKEEELSFLSEKLTEKERADKDIQLPWRCTDETDKHFRGIGKSTIKIIQKKLSENGFFAGRINGSIGTDTKSAIEDWQNTKVYTETGFLTYAQQLELLGFALTDDPACKPGLQEFTENGRINSGGIIVTKQFDDGSIYEGTFRDGLQHGIGTYRLPNGYEYVGDWVDGEIKGQGIATFPNGSVYEGNFEKGKPEGNGKITFADGGTYEGSWLDGEISGQGVANYANGARYEGGFEEAAHHGRGIMSNADGYIYDGDWVKGKKQGLAKVTYPDGAIYEGDIVDGKRQGTGKLLMPDGIVFEGSWSDGQINGMGKLIQPNGDTYEGMLVNGSRQGEGRVVYANGDVYDGNFEKDQRQGQGTFSGQDGYSYIGNWSGGQMEGAGEVVYPDGSTYIGNFTAGIQSGKGKITYPDGSSYDGDWVNGLIEGEGVATYPNGITYKGGFKNARNHGFGVMTYSDGYTYEGDWVDGMRHGKGKATFADGMVYEGEYENSQRHGTGKITLADGFSYEGTWENGEINGFGKATYSNGDVYEGNFVNGKRQGEGTITFASGEEETGKWKNGNLVSSENDGVVKEN